MNEPVISIASAFLVGLLGGLHCIGMCGGISGSLGFAVANQSGLRRLLVLLYFNLGRIGSYMLAGALIGGFGVLLQGPLAPLGPWMRVFAGLMMIAMGFYLAGWWRGLLHLERAGDYLLWRRLQPLTRRIMPVTGPAQALALGALWGWLPCGLVYSTLTLAGSLAHWQDSALVMASFGIGTLPLMLAAGVFAGRLQGLVRRSDIRAGAGMLIIGFGIWTLSVPLLHQIQMSGH